MKIVFFMFLLITGSSELFSQDINSIELKEISSGNSVLVKNTINKKGAFIIFVDNSCAFVDSYNARLTAITRDLTSKGYSVLFVNPHEKNSPASENVNAMKQFFSDKNWSGKYFSDANQELVKLLGATKLPEVFFVTLNGTQLRVVYQGALDDNPQNAQAVKTTYIANAEKMHSEGGKVTPAKVPALGCRIKRF